LGIRYRPLISGHGGKRIQADFFSGGIDKEVQVAHIVVEIKEVFDQLMVASTTTDGFGKNDSSAYKMALRSFFTFSFREILSMSSMTHRKEFVA
jgi:hypothetical protein